MRNTLFGSVIALSIAVVTFTWSTIASAAEMSALDVIRQVDARYDGESSLADYTMILIDRRERERRRNLHIYSKDYGEDSRSYSHFETPADIRGTSYLNFDWADPERDDDSWLYLPALQRVRRIAGSDTSDSFLGSDFTYADINGIETEYWDYRFINESEMINDQDTWVIEANPKPGFTEKAEDSTGYSKLQFWIRKDNFIQLRAQAWALRGNRVKFFSSSEIEEIDGIWTINRLQAITTRNGRREHASVLQLNSIEYNLEIDDDLFTIDNMQRGID